MYQSFNLYGSPVTTNPLDQLAVFETSYLNRYGKLPNYAMVNSVVFAGIDQSIAKPALNAAGIVCLKRADGLCIAPSQTIALNNIALTFDDDLPARSTSSPASNMSQSF